MKGQRWKIIAVPLGDPRYEEIRTIEDMGSHMKKEFEHFFSEYKQLEGKEVHVKGWADVKEAQIAIEKAKENFK